MVILGILVILTFAMTEAMLVVIVVVMVVVMVYVLKVPNYYISSVLADDDVSNPVSSG